MKQHITVEQLNEISDKEKQILAVWLVEKKYAEGYRVDQLMRITHQPQIAIRFQIGQMIEFLIDNSSFEDFHIYYEPQPESHNWWLDHWADMEKELADCLWEAVKEILHKKLQNNKT